MTSDVPQPILDRARSQSPCDPEQRRAGGDELAERRDELEPAVGPSRLLDQLVVADPGDDAGLAPPRRRPSSRLVVRPGPWSGYFRSSRVRVSLPTSSISAETRSACPMWCT